jgi:hypothetical protein
MNDILVSRISRAFDLTKDLVLLFGDEDFMLKISDFPSNTIGDQFRCILGSRESYLEALQDSE